MVHRSLDDVPLQAADPLGSSVLPYSGRGGLVPIAVIEDLLIPSVAKVSDPCDAEPVFCDTGDRMTHLLEGPIAPVPTCVPPGKREHIGQSVKLVPLDEHHAEDLWQAAQDADESWTYLGYGPFTSFDDFKRHIAKLAALADQPFFAVIPTGGAAGGWLSYCDIEPHNAAIEIGSIWFAPRLQRTRAATEAVYLLLDHAFEQGFNRVAWRCNALNMPSRRAAERFGFVFEGTWRMAQIIKGRWRDTSWYSQLVDEWPENKAAFSHWLAGTNFDESGQQRSPLR